MDKVYLRLRAGGAFEVTSGEEGTFNSLMGHKYALLVTFRRSGKAVPTPVWFGLGDHGRVYVHSFADGGKVKRLRTEPRALLAPCTVRGRPLGSAVEGRGRILPREEWDCAERAIESNYSLGRRLYTVADDESAMTYLEIVPVSAG